MLGMENLSRAEKLRMMETIWDDLTRHVVTLSSPEWHADELKETERAYEQKRIKMLSWDVAKKALRGDCRQRPSHISSVLRGQAQKN